MKFTAEIREKISFHSKIILENLFFLASIRIVFALSIAIAFNSEINGEQTTARHLFVIWRYFCVLRFSYNLLSHSHSHQYHFNGDVNRLHSYFSLEEKNEKKIHILVIWQFAFHYSTRAHSKSSVKNKNHLILKSVLWLLHPIPLRACVCSIRCKLILIWKKSEKYGIF